MGTNGRGEIALQSGFSQSGQLDWATFLRSTAEASISILTRLSGSGVDPLTILVAQNAFSTLRLSVDGERNMQEALSRLQSFRSFGNFLWFGFGVEHVSRSLAKTREGLEVVAVCAALGESHSSELTALVLSEFSDLNGLRRPLSPSIAQWKQLIQACSGCLAGSGFQTLFVSSLMSRMYTPIVWKISRLQSPATLRKH